jgi:hypothetical protein
MRMLVLREIVVVLNTDDRWQKKCCEIAASMKLRISCDLLPVANAQRHSRKEKKLTSRCQK